VKIYLSAIETSFDHALAVTRVKAPHLLTSFYYCEWKTGLGQRRPMWERALRQAKLRLADSGAHTFRTAGYGITSGPGAGAALATDLDEFLAAYINWVKRTKHRGLIDYWVELDVGIITGDQWLTKHRQKFLGAGLGAGLLQVWHSEENDWNGWIELLRESCMPGRSRYVAIEGHNNQARAPHDYTRFLRAAYERGVRVHTFKITGHEDLKRWPFYSVDSTSWIAPTMYGCDVQVVRTGGVTHSRAKSQMPGQRKAYLASTSGVTSTMRSRVDVLVRSAEAWVESERHLTEIWSTRGVDWDRAILQPKVIV
jgi:hypothetical protein